MPELPEVETVVRGLRQAMRGRKLTRVDLNRKDLRFPLPKHMDRRLAGQTVADVTRRAKYILIHLDSDETLLCHLGMTGRFLVQNGMSATPQPHDHVILHFDSSLSVTYNDARRFGMMDMVKTDGLNNHKLMRHLGIEPLSRSFTGRLLHDRLAGKKTSVKAVLLDQTVVVGIGNIYASEALFLAGIAPQRLAGSITKTQAEKLAAAIKTVLKRAIAAGGSSLRDYKQANGELGYFQHQWAVYDREGEACGDCTCDLKKTGGVKRVVQAGRSSFYCPSKQS